jgi:hypothetical protein
VQINLRVQARGWAARAGASGTLAAAPGPRRVLADLDPELHGLPVGIPAGVLGEGEEPRRLRFEAAHVTRPRPYARELRASGTRCTRRFQK